MYVLLMIMKFYFIDKILVCYCLFWEKKFSIYLFNSYSLNNLFFIWIIYKINENKIK